MRWISCLIATTTMVLGASSRAWADLPNHYVGVGIRAGFNDSTAAVIDSKVKLVDLSEVNEVSASIRPALLLGDEAELRFPLSIETEFGEGFFPFLGGGIAYNVDGTSDVDPMITAGIDINVANNIILNLEGNFIFQSSDTDTEFMASINYAF